MKLLALTNRSFHSSNHLSSLIQYLFTSDFPSLSLAGFRFKKNPLHQSKQKSQFCSEETFLSWLYVVVHCDLNRFFQVLARMCEKLRRIIIPSGLINSSHLTQRAMTLHGLAGWRELALIYTSVPSVRLCVRFFCAHAHGLFLH